MSSQLVYHERQAAALCGCHALNNLVQTKAFTEFDLAEIALELDAQERQLMLQNGADSEDAVKFLAEGSTNVDDSGNFSITVLREALARSYGIELSAEKQDVDAALRDPATAFECYVLNLESHWFAIRKLYGMWFNLNSMNKTPEYIGEFYLAAFLAQMKAQGYYIFVAKPSTGGRLPSPQLDTADASCLHTVADIRSGKAAREAAAVRDNARRQAEAEAEEDPDLAAALAASLAEAGQAPSSSSSYTRARPGQGGNQDAWARAGQGYTVAAPRAAVQLDADGFEVYDPSAFDSPGRSTLPVQSAFPLPTAGAAAVPASFGAASIGRTTGTGTTALPRFDFSGVASGSTVGRTIGGVSVGTTTSAAAAALQPSAGASGSASASLSSARSNDVVRAHWAAKYPKASPAPAPAQADSGLLSQPGAPVPVPVPASTGGQSQLPMPAAAMAGTSTGVPSPSAAGMKRAASDMSIVDESVASGGEASSSTPGAAGTQEGKGTGAAAQHSTQAAGQGQGDVVAIGTVGGSASAGE